MGFGGFVGRGLACGAMLFGLGLGLGLAPGPGLPNALAASATAGPVAYALDRTHTFVTFEVLHFDTATLRGRFGPLDGQAELDVAGRQGRVQVVIDTAQVSTGLPVLDALLRRADLLDVETHPKAYFVAEAFEFDPQGRVSAVSGEFTLRGISRGLKLQAQRWRCYLNPLFRREVCGGDFVAEFKRSDFGITHSLPFVSDTVRLLVQVEGIRQSATP